MGGLNLSWTRYGMTVDLKYNYYIYRYYRYSEIQGHSRTRKLASLAIIQAYNYIVGCKHRASEVLLYIGGRGLVSQIIEPVTFARCAFIIALRNITLDGYLDTRRNF